MSYASLSPTLRTADNQDLIDSLLDEFVDVFLTYSQTRGGNFALTTSPTSVSLSGLGAVDAMIVQNLGTTNNVTLTYKAAAAGTLTFVLTPGEVHITQDVDVAQAPTLASAASTTSAKLRVYAD